MIRLTRDALEKTGRSYIISFSEFLVLAATNDSVVRPSWYAQSLALGLT